MLCDFNLYGIHLHIANSQLGSLWGHDLNGLKGHIWPDIWNK